MQFLFSFLENVALLTLLGLGVYFIEASRTQLGWWRSQVAHGLAFGSAAFLVTVAPLTLSDGATLDARAGPVLLAATFGGPPWCGTRQKS